MASATGTRGTALLFSFSAILFVVLLLQAPAAPGGLAVADLLASALDRFLDGRGLMELATRRNMILLCHAILLLILRDAGVLGALARRPSRSPPGEDATATAAVVAQTAAAVPARLNTTRSAVVAHTASCSAVPVPARPHATRGTVVWRRQRPRNRAVVAPMREHDAAGRVVVECRPEVEAVATWAAPVVTTGPPAQAAEEAAAVGTKQIVVAESPRDDDDELLYRHDRASVVEPLEHPKAISADGESDEYDDDRLIVTLADDDDDEKRVDDHTAGLEMEIELADDKTFEEFIESQRRQMRQESLQLFRSGYQYQAIAACY